MTALTTLVRQIEQYACAPSRRNIIEAAARGTIGELAIRAGVGDRSLPGWPRCACLSCDDCGEPADRIDGDCGEPVCDACADYTLGGNGDVICSRHPDAEVVSESCGAAGQMRTYVRLRAPAMPEPDPDGEWCVYWDTVGDDPGVIARYATRADAEQAVAAHDWPPPGDHTAYLCGYKVRTLVDGEWVAADAGREG